MLLLGRGQVARQSRHVGLETGDLRGEQRRAQLGDEELDGVPLSLGLIPLGEGGVVFRRRGGDGLECGELFTRALDRVVGAGEVVEVGDDVADALSGVAGLEHVVADEVVEVADRLHRHGLVEELERLLGADSEKAPERHAVLGEVVEDVGAGAAQSLPQVAQVATKVGEVRSDGQSFGRRDVEAVGLAGALALLEDLRERDCVVVALVDEDTQDDRVGAAVRAQADGTRSSGLLDPLGLVVALDVGPEGALLGVCASRLVVRDAVTGQQQRGQCVNESGLARADVAGEQCRLRTRGQPPHLPVEGAPVENLEVVQPVAGQGTGGELNAREEAVTHWSSPPRRTPATWLRSPTASRRRRRP